MCKRIIAVVLCAALVVSILPVLSFSASADNSGFCQIRVFYKVKDANGNWTAERSAIINDNSFISIPTRNMQIPLQITRFLVRNDSDSLCYFQFDINFGGLTPNSGTSPTASYTSLFFTTNGGVTAYNFDTTDKSNFVFYDNNTSGGAIPRVFNSAASRTFFGKVENTGYITFDTPVNIIYRPNDSVSDQMVMFFRHLVIGNDNSSYLANMEQYLSSIDSNVDSIAGWMEEEHDMYQQSWDNGAGAAYNDAFGGAGGFFGSLFGFSQFSFFSSYFNFNTVFSSTSDLISRWFSQSNYNNINGSYSKSPPPFVDYFSANLNGELDVWGGEEDD